MPFLSSVAAGTAKLRIRPDPVQEKRLISKFFDEISQDSGKHTSGVKDTLACLEMGAVDTLIVWESLDIQRLELRNPTSGNQSLRGVHPESQMAPYWLVRHGTLSVPQLTVSCKSDP